MAQRGTLEDQCLLVKYSSTLVMRFVNSQTSMLYDSMNRLVLRTTLLIDRMP